MRYSTIGLSCVPCLLIGCAASTQSALAGEAQQALRVIELAESLYFAEDGSNAVLQLQVAAVNDAAEAAITAYGSASTTAGIVARDVDDAFAALRAIDSAYAELATVDAGRAAQFQQCMALAQAAVAVSVQLASGS